MQTTCSTVTGFEAFSQGRRHSQRRQAHCTHRLISIAPIVAMPVTPLPGPLLSPGSNPRAKSDSCDAGHNHTIAGSLYSSELHPVGRILGLFSNTFSNTFSSVFLQSASSYHRLQPCLPIARPAISRETPPKLLKKSAPNFLFRLLQRASLSEAFKGLFRKHTGYAYLVGLYHVESKLKRRHRIFAMQLGHAHMLPPTRSQNLPTARTLGVQGKPYGRKPSALGLRPRSQGT